MGEPKSSSVGPTRTRSPAGRKSRPSSAFITSETDAKATSATPQKASHIEKASITTQTLSTAPVSINYSFAPTSILPKDTISYSKAIQTSEQWEPQRQENHAGVSSGSDSDQLRSPTRSPRKVKRLSRRERDREEQLRQSIRQEIEEEIKAVKEPGADGISAQPKYPARALTSEELDAVTGSNEFLDFVERSSKVIEKALDQDYDILANYALDGQEELDDEDRGYGHSRGKKGRRLRQIAQFYDERWSKKRMISDLEFSPKVTLLSAVLPHHPPEV